MSTTTQALQQASVFKIGRSIALRLGGPGVLLLLVWPWILLAVNRSWIFLNGTFVDSWIYFGFFNNLPEYLKIYAAANSSQLGFYYDDRLSWILPGYLIYYIFPPLVANYVLHFGLYYVIVLALYATLRLTIHPRVALLAALLMGSYSHFLIAVGWDYVDGPGLAYFSLTLLLLTLAAKRSRWLLWLGLAGATAAALIFSNIFWVALTPSLALYYLLLNRRRPIKLIALGLAPLAIGALSLTLAVGLINIAFGGPFLFFASSLEFAAYSSRLPTNPWIRLPVDWPIRNPHLVWPSIIMLACGLWLAIGRLRARFSAYPQALLFLAVFLFMALIMLALQLRRSSPVLQAFFYASYLIPALFLAIGAILAPFVIGLSRARFAGVISVTMLASLLSFSFRACGEVPLEYPALPAITLGLIWIILLICLPNHIWSYGVFALAFFVATPSAFTSFSQEFATNSFCSVAPRTQPRPEDQYLAVRDGMQAIRQIAPEKHVFFWYNEKEQPIYSALSSTYLYTWNQISRDFPSVSGPGSSFPGFAPPSGNNRRIVI